MKNTFWIVQNNLNLADRVLTFIFSEHNIKHEFIDIVPFSQAVPEVAVPANHNVIARGSTTMMIGAQKQPWFPGIWLNDNFKPSWYQSSFKENFLNHQGQAVGLSGIISLFDKFNSEQLFIRADTDYKELSGEVYTRDQAQDLINKIKSDNFYFGNDLTVFVAPLVSIKEEYRLVVVNNKVVSGMSYKINGVATNIPAPAEIVAFGQSLSHLGPDQVYCLDIGKTGDNQLGVIECNCFNGSGLYGDQEAIVLAVDKFTKTL